jgi:hypothetical protein
MCQPAWLSCKVQVTGIFGQFVLMILKHHFSFMATKIFLGEILNPNIPLAFFTWQVLA